MVPLTMTPNIHLETLRATWEEKTLATFVCERKPSPPPSSQQQPPPQHQQQRPQAESPTPTQATSAKSAKDTVAPAAVVETLAAQSETDWRASVNAVALEMSTFADGSPVGLILEVLEEHPDLRAQIVGALHARLKQLAMMGAPDHECA